MLHYGKPPETLKEKIVYFFRWKGKSADKMDVWADRTALAQILGYVADKTAAQPTAEVPNIDQDLPPPVTSNDSSP